MNKLIVKLLSSRKQPKVSGGFTLIELLIGASLTLVALTIAGGSLAWVTNGNKVAKSETERRVEFNRALDFMADEIRQAKPIATTASDDLSVLAPGFDSTGKTPVLTLHIPGVSQRIIYYVAAKPSTGSDAAYFGPNLVYRWGPAFNSSGAYSNASNEPVTGNNNPASWQAKPLVDSIVDTAPTLPLCSAVSSSSTLTPCVESSTIKCNTGYLNPPSASVKGFYACVDAGGKIAKLNLRGTLSDAYGTSLTPYEVTSNAFARPNNTSFTLNSGSSSSGGNGGTITITQPSAAYFEILGGDIRCTGGSPIATTTTIHITPSGGTTTNTIIPTSPQAVNLPSLATGTTVTVSGVVTSGGNNTCGLPTNTYNSQTDNNHPTNGTHVLTLRNGDTVPTTTPFGGASAGSIDSYLTNYFDTSTRKIKLAENQVIFLFELYTPTSGSTYDLQDMVVLATISPTN
jgi:type II secretory pathway pseudopilin PulG